MATSTVGGWKRLKRLARYLIGKPRRVYKYPWQGKEKTIDGYSDSDWAGCRVTGKSKSGGALLIGHHFMKGWSRTQNYVTTSSAEAELVVMVKCSAELLGMRSLMMDVGRDSSGVLYADSAAALAIANRKGAGKLRHINVSALWVQEEQGTGEVAYTKVLGTERPHYQMLGSSSHGGLYGAHRTG